jgi:hypothetical protein
MVERKPSKLEVPSSTLGAGFMVLQRLVIIMIRFQCSFIIKALRAVV